jgi:hypothetical protein
MQICTVKAQKAHCANTTSNSFWETEHFSDAALPLATVSPMPGNNIALLALKVRCHHT